MMHSFLRGTCLRKSVELPMGSEHPQSAHTLLVGWRIKEKASTFGSFLAKSTAIITLYKIIITLLNVSVTIVLNTNTY